MTSEKIRFRSVPTNGLNLHVAEAGEPGQPLLLLLHGFPEFWYSWRHQISYFAAQGYHVVAPDQRGYNLSDKPRDVSAYRLDALGSDIAGLITSLGHEQAFVAGHDWGGMVAWWLSMHRPERIRKLAILNAPHPRAMRQQLLQNRAQRRKSWYIFFYQLPWLPERWMRKNNWAIGAKTLQATSLRGTFSDADVARYREAWSQPGCATAMLNWYRANLRRFRLPGEKHGAHVQVPLLLIWGVKDRFLGRELAEASLPYCTDARLAFIDEATHWVQHDAPKEVNALIADFLREK